MDFMNFIVPTSSQTDENVQHDVPADIVTDGFAALLDPDNNQPVKDVHCCRVSLYLIPSTGI